MPSRSRPVRMPARTGSTAVGAAAEQKPAGDGPRRSAGPTMRPKNGVDRYFEVTARR